jgi:tetratricopeptide (TPR) repeat protein
VVFAVALSGLSGLTAWNLSRSDALEEARRADQRGDAVSALRGALDHLGRRPWSRDAALLAARCLSRLDYPDDAEPYYRRAGGLSPDDLHARAYGFVRGNQRARAIRAYEEILRHRPDDVMALRLLAGVQLTQSNEAEVLRQADRLVRIPEGAPIGYTLRGTIEHNRKNRGEAVAAFERVLEIDPDLRVMPFPRPIFWGDLAADLIKIGRPGDAARYLTRALERDRDVSLMNTLGRAYDQAGDQDAAARCFRQAAEWDPKDFTPHLYLGRLELHRRRLDEAVPHLERAVELAPRQFEALSHLAVAYRQLGRTADADRVQGRIDRLRARRPAAPRNPNTPVPRYAL